MPLKNLASLNSLPSRAKKILFDVDESWRKRLSQVLSPTLFTSKMVTFNKIFCLKFFTFRINVAFQKMNGKM